MKNHMSRFLLLSVVLTCVYACKPRKSSIVQSDDAPKGSITSKQNAMIFGLHSSCEVRERGVTIDTLDRVVHVDKFLQMSKLKMSKDDAQKFRYVKIANTERNRKNLVSLGADARTPCKVTDALVAYDEWSFGAAGAAPTAVPPAPTSAMAPRSTPTAAR